MCGIAGVVGLAAERAEPMARRMLAALTQRGPDASGLEILRCPGSQTAVVLAHTRLAVLDPTPVANQPMVRGGDWIVFNGEIYNYRELADELTPSEGSLRTRGDTEVILEAYRAWGASAVERLRGMFAFCLADTEAGRVWLCRDRLGIKPLYVARPAGGGVFFASEVRALLAAGAVPRRAGAAGVASFLAQGAVFDLASLIPGIELLAPGASVLLDWDGREVGRKSYWQAPFRGEGGAPSRETAVGELGQALRRAVSSHLVSDVPLGLFLSGGVDSASIAALATELRPDLETVTIGFDHPEFDESDRAERIARALGTRHRTVRLTGDEVLSRFDEVLAAVDQPTVDGFNTFFVSHAARQLGLKVVLSGLGGDELFGGYASFREVPLARQIGRVLSRTPRLRRALSGLADRSGRRSGVKLAELCRSPVDIVTLYLLRRELWLGDERELLLGPGRREGVANEVVADLQARTLGLDPVHQVCLLELQAYMRHMLLRDSDVFSMAHGLELRVPLLDHELVESVLRLPASWKRSRPPKALLLDAVGPRLPRSLLRGPKQGFTFPWSPWLRGPLRGRAQQAVDARQTWLALGIDPRSPPKLWERFLGSDPRAPGLGIIALVVLEDYARRHALEAA